MSYNHPTLVHNGVEYEMAVNKADTLCAHGVIVPVTDVSLEYRFCTAEEMAADPGSPTHRFVNAGDEKEAAELWLFLFQQALTYADGD